MRRPGSGSAALAATAYVNVPASTGRRLAGTIVSALAALFLLFDAVAKVLRLDPVVEGTTRLGYPESAVALIGAIELACLVAYVVPRTSVLGAILMTGYLGGAVATHLRLGNPLLTHTLFPVYVGLAVWAGLFLREGRLPALLPVRR